MQSITSVEELDEELSRPTPGVLQTLDAMDGDIIILGASGKMGPTLSRMLRRGCDQIGDRRRVLAVSRFSNPQARESLHAWNIETISCDLLDPEAVKRLPEAPHVFFMAGQKFGTSDAPEKTWAMNTLAPAYVADRFRNSNVVAFSTGCVYPLVAASSRGADEQTPLAPPGDYANSCVGRERIFTYFSNLHQTPVCLFRLCYAIDLRYGVLCDIASKVLSGHPVDVSMGWVNILWQRDANARAIQSLSLCQSPPFALNVTGIEKISVRDLALRIGELTHRTPRFLGLENEMAWIWDASKSYELFGAPTKTLDEMIHLTTTWLLRGGRTLGKPTHFEVSDGVF